MTGDSPGGYVVVTFGHESDVDERVCPLNRCVMGVDWFPDRESADAYMHSLPAWTVPHCLPLNAPAARTGTPRGGAR